MTDRVWSGTTLTQRRDQRRRQLLTAGRKLLGAGGTDAVSVRAVCRTAGLTERYFYESFTDRDALVMAVYEHVAGQAHDALVAATSAGGADREQLARAAVDAFVGLIVDHPGHGRILLLSPLTDPALARRGLEFTGAFAALVSVHLPDTPDRDLAAAALVGAFTRLFIGYLDGTLAVSRDRLVAFCVRLLLTAG